MHTPEYQRPAALTHTTDLLGSPYEVSCVHSPSLTCELSLAFANHVRVYTSIASLWAEFNLYWYVPERSS